MTASPRSRRQALRFGAVLVVEATLATTAGRTAVPHDGSRTCLAASGLRFARVTGQPAVFDGRLPFDALLVSGRPRQRWLHGRLVTMLCLYDRRTRRAQAVAAPGWPHVLR